VPLVKQVDPGTKAPAPPPPPPGAPPPAPPPPTIKYCTVYVVNLTVKLTVLVVVAAIPLASTTVNVTLAVEYVAFGVPLTRPVLVLSVIPEGNVPDCTLYVYGLVPPDTLLNGLKLVIATFIVAVTPLVVPAVAVV
jgi:hypothetical protein